MIRCTSSFQLLFTLHSLDSLVRNKPDVRLLIVDSLSAVYVPSYGVNPPSKQRRTKDLHFMSLSDPNAKLISHIITELAQVFKLVVMVANSLLSNQLTRIGGAKRKSDDVTPEVKNSMTTSTEVAQNYYSVTDETIKDETNNDIQDKPMVKTTTFSPSSHCLLPNVTYILRFCKLERRCWNDGKVSVSEGRDLFEVRSFQVTQPSVAAQLTKQFWISDCGLKFF